MHNLGGGQINSDPVSGTVDAIVPLAVFFVIYLIGIRKQKKKLQDEKSNK